MKIFIKVVVSLILLIVSVNTFAKKPFIENFTKMQYHAANKNWSITQDQQGGIYFGNDLGLLEYDGIKWTLYKLEKNEVVRAVEASSTGVIYTGGYEEFGYWKRGLEGKLQYYSLSDNLPIGSFHNDDIWRIWEDKGKVYFQSFKSIYVYDDGDITEISGKNVLFLSKIYDELWIQQMYGPLFRVVDNEYELIPGSEIFQNTGVQTVLPYGDNQYLIATSTAGIYTYDGSKFTKLGISSELINSELNCGILSSDGNYYFGTILNGVYVISSDGRIINHFDTDNYMQNNTVLSLKEDTHGNIWVALDKGITCIRNSDNLSYYIDFMGKIGAVYAASLYAGKLFIGTNQGVFYTEINNLSTITSASQLTFLPGIQGQVWDLTVVDGKLYCGHNRGVAIIDESLKVSSPYPINTGVFSIVPNSDGTILLGTYTSLSLIDPITNRYTEFDKIREPINRVVVDHLGNIWLEHMNKGVYRCHLNAEKTMIDDFTYFGNNKDNNLPYNIRLFKVGGRATFLGKDQFYTYNDIQNRFESYSLLDSVMTGINDLKSVFNIDKNSFWIVGNNILYKLYCNGIEAYIEDKVDINSSNISLVNSFERIVPLNDSISLICLDNGFVLYDNNGRLSDKKIEKPYLTSLSAMNSRKESIYMDFSNNIEISYLYNTIRLAFSDKDAISTDLYFQYKLEGLGDWSAPQKINEVTYERLPKGKYTFWIRAVDRLGNQSESVKYDFKINSPWYQSVWAYLMYLVLTLALITAIWNIVLIRYRNIHLRKIRERETKRLKLQNTQLESQVKERDAELLSQTSAIIQRNELMLKIKDELDLFHEKFNNKSFTPLFHKINALLNNNMDAEEDWKTFLIKFEQKHPTFFKFLKTNYPQLTANDLKLCACLKLNLDSKEIASLMNVSVRAVENSRYRLRKKIDIPSNQNLNDFFVGL